MNAPGDRGILSKIEMETTKRFQDFIQAFTGWANTQSAIRSVALVGSYARGEPTGTSDVDLVMLVEDPNVYLNETGWIKRFGNFHRMQVEDYGLVKSLRVWYHDGLEVEYGLTTRTWVEPPIDDGTRRVIQGGLQILLDKEDLLSHLKH
jgi:predicted nucleotidyltransferase